MCQLFHRHNGEGLWGGDGWRKPCRRQVEVRQCSRVAHLKRRWRSCAEKGKEEKAGDRWAGGTGAEEDGQGRLMASSRCHPPPQYRSDVCVYTSLCVWMRHTRCVRSVTFYLNTAISDILVLLPDVHTHRVHSAPSFPIYKLNTQQYLLTLALMKVYKNKDL